ncbi:MULTISPECIES: lasso RiPP family leader peptide-containing protein [Brevundimonas]|uniref:Lasso RiPP family leader peptide-containing protein n=1 Tax=Brevundimonas vesicularis TaxID=41276 RepID=A0ABU4KTD4_BREVE|nr:MULTISPECIES: lasso RiPP family leader peptide-containing protein [Brevundimonas]MDX2336170.1 lasso RiPP family leader peptide-containing protein [Brevundimonas vesicularis]
MTTVKTPYEAPEMTSLGSFETLTQGASRGSQLDATFPTGTPFGELTFS